MKRDVFLLTLLSENKKIKHKNIIKQADAVVAGVLLTQSFLKE